MRTSVLAGLLGVLVLCLAVLGCAEEDDPKLKLLQVQHTPLDPDPTKPYELKEWWTSTSRLLRLRDDNRYTLWDGLNHHHRPQQQGHWIQDSYAALRLEPYEARVTPAIRVSVRRLGAAMVLVIGEDDIFLSLGSPPYSVEDELLGAWDCTNGILTLRANRAYDYQPRDGSTDLIGHRGEWTVQKGSLLLHPSTPAVQITRLSIRRENGAAAILAPEEGTGVYQRAR